ncbi:hypothetical protein ACGFJC_47540 [Nonomuraea fuscirosea]|uniref:hypothetical protein n=1 Tax=Nonomuraea fuscirosea TaxID=1291556 RepID=UPI0037111F5F
MPRAPERSHDELRADGSVYAMRSVADALTHAVHHRDPFATEILTDLTTDELYRLCIALAELRGRSQADDGIIDRIAINRALDGHKVKLRDPERIEIAQRFITEGRSRTQFADLLKLSTETARTMWEQAQGILAYARHRGTVTGALHDSERERFVSPELAA